MLLLYYMCDINNGIISHLPVYLCTLTLVSGRSFGFGFEQNFVGWTDLAKNRHGLADLLTPIHSGP